VLYVARKARLRSRNVEEFYGFADQQPQRSK
jgi:hypothetical protein